MKSAFQNLIFFIVNIKHEKELAKSTDYEALISLYVSRNSSQAFRNLCRQKYLEFQNPDMPFLSKFVVNEIFGTYRKYTMRIKQSVSLPLTVLCKLRIERLLDQNFGKTSMQEIVRWGLERSKTFFKLIPMYFYIAYCYQLYVYSRTMPYNTKLISTQYIIRS